MGIGEWFGDFCTRIQVQKGEAISRRFKAITQRLNTDFRNTTSDVANSFYTGSFGRNTAIDRTSDVDMTYVLPYATYAQYNNHTGNGQSALLQAVRNSILATYSSSSVGADGQVVIVPFTDGITFEVLPAFQNDDGSYTFPDANTGGSWKTTNPKPEIEAMRVRNSECNGNLVQLCRMMRGWKAEWKVPISGLLLDTLAYQFIENWKYRDKSFFYYDFMSRDFFAHLASEDKDKEWWRAPGSGQYVYASRGQFQYKATQCFNLAEAAIKHEQATPKEEWSAKQKWRSIYGTDLPS